MKKSKVKAEPVEDVNIDEVINAVAETTSEEEATIDAIVEDVNTEAVEEKVEEIKHEEKKQTTPKKVAKGKVSSLSNFLY